MILKKLDQSHSDIPALKKLFEEAFPENERPMSMDVILAYLDQLPCDLLGVYPDETPDKFSGFFFGVRGESGVYGVYFATCPELRSSGIGSKASSSIMATPRSGSPTRVRSKRATTPTNASGDADFT